MPKFTTKRYPVVSAIAVLLIIAVAAALVDFDKAKSVLSAINGSYVWIAILLVAVSYLSEAFGFLCASRIFGIIIPKVEIIEIAFVSNVLTNLLSAAGIAGHSFRILTMRREKITAGDVTAVSIFHAYFNNAAFFLLMPLSLLYILSTNLFTREESDSLMLAGGVFLGLFVLSSLALFVPAARKKITAAAAAFIRLFKKNYDTRAFLDNFDAAAERGIRSGRKNPALVSLMVFFVVIDWVAMLGVFALCFYALGNGIGLGKILVAFAAGISAGVISNIPGGLGVQEGSVAGILTLFGVSLEVSLLAALLFRIIFYVFPLAISLAFFGKIMFRLGKET